MAGGQRSRARSTNTATLGCGVVLTFSASSFVPEVDERVPCPRHGYCAVSARRTTERPRRRPPARRSTRELAEFLSEQPVTSVHVLRGHRFTLRVVAAAEKEGLLDLDLLSGRVALRRGRPTSNDDRESA